MSKSREPNKTAGIFFSCVWREKREKKKERMSKELDRNNPDGSHLFVFTAPKAGMESSERVVDQEKANRIILDLSKNSRFFKNAQKRDSRVDKRIEQMMHKLRSIPQEPLPATVQQIDTLISEIEAARDLENVWAVVDMDMFFAAVEIRDNPSLKGKPIAVGGMSMISTASYEARKYGVRSAMPGFIGLRLCPELVFGRECVRFRIDLGG